MASNIATKRLIDRLQPSVGAVEIADDIWVCPANKVSEVRAVLADQPHFLYFLDRGIKADEFSMNGDGQKFWVLRNPSWTAGPENPVLFDLAYSESSSQSIRRLRPDDYSPAGQRVRSRGIHDHALREEG